MPFALGAMALVGFVLAGCSKEEAPSADPASPASYMNDKAFLGKLKEQKSARDGVLARHLAARRAYEEALKADPKGVRSETQELKKKMDALQDEYRALRQKTMRTVGERLAPKKGGKISK